jgi:hypothetical protein
MTDTPSQTPAPPVDDDGSEHYAAYEEHAKTLRTWLVAYGIGAPVLIVSEDQMWKALASTGVFPLITSLFLSGVALQVILSAANKSAMWACYYGQIEPTFKNSIRHRFGVWLSSRYFIDFCCDILSMALFAAATYFALNALARANVA